MGWVGLGRDFSVFGAFGWVHYSKSRPTKNSKGLFSAFKARLDKIWLHQAVKLDFVADDRYWKLIRRNNKVIMLANDS